MNAEAIAEGAAFSAFTAGSQHNRLLRLEFPQGDGPDAILLVNTLWAREEVSRCFRITAEVLSDDARIPLKALMACMVTISMVREDGTLRYFNGYVTQFRFDRTDGGFAFYTMVLEPWLAFTKLRMDNVSFHYRSVMELTEDTFKHYLQRDCKPLLLDPDPRLTVANQHNETDYNHLHRRWEAHGLHYWYEHREDGHTLYLSDRSVLAEPIHGDEDYADADQIPFRDKAGAMEDDAIYSWAAIRTIGSGPMTLASFDYKRPHPHLVDGYSVNQQGDVFAHEVYENTGSYGFPTRDEGYRLTQRRIEERDKNTQYFEAAGNDRTVQPRRFFTLGGHFSAELQGPRNGEAPRPSIGFRDYMILAVEHIGRNNYQAGPGAPSHYENSFECIRKTITWRPGRNFNSVPCANPGVQTALVVGPAGSEIHTDGYGRVRIQFHWDRLGKFDENSSPWIRVMTPAAGHQFGHIRLPRVGEEVVIQFLDGNIDHPIIIGSVYNDNHMPPWKLPSQKVLEGARSRELKPGAGRANHLILDDTSGKIQAQLKSDHLHSQISLGHITRIEDNAGRKDERGEGFELRTDGHGVTRAAKGMLITTEPRVRASGPIKDMWETLHRLNESQREHELLGKLAHQHQAQDVGASQEGVALTIKKQNEDVEGSGNACPELTKPHIVLASPVGIASTTGGSTHIASDQHTALTTGKNLSIAAGVSFFASVRQTFRLFVHKAGMKMIAGAGDIDIQALTDSINLLAKLNITHTANRIIISAKEEVVINGGGSYVKFRAGGIEHGTSGTSVIHATSHNVTGPKNITMAFAMPKFSDEKSKSKGFLHLGSHGAASGYAQSGLPFKLFKNDSMIESGLIDKQGNMKFDHDIEANSKYRVELANGQQFEIDPGDLTEPHMESASIGYHGYENPGGSLTEDPPNRELDRITANPSINKRHQDKQ